MAKRVPADEKPYRPVDEALVQSVLNPLLSREVLSNGPEPPPGSETLNGRGDSDVRVPEPEARSPAAEAATIATIPEPVPLAPSVPPGEKLSREKRVLLSRSEEREVERLIAD